MVLCAAVGCNSRTDKPSTDRVSFFKFPRDAARRKIWTQRIRRVNYAPNDSSRLCSRHFATDQFVPSSTRAFCDGIGYTHRVMPRLVDDALPTIFDFAKTPTARKSALTITKKKFVLKVTESSTDITSSTNIIARDTCSVQHVQIDHDYVLPSDSASRRASISVSEDVTIDAPRDSCVSESAISDSSVSESAPSESTSVSVSNSNLPFFNRDGPFTATHLFHMSELPAPSPLQWFASVTADLPRLETRPLMIMSTDPPKTDPPAERYSIQCQTPYDLTSRRAMMVQAQPETREFSTQTDPISSQLELPRVLKCNSCAVNDSFVSEISEPDQRDDDLDDPDWQPDEELSSSDDDDEIDAGDSDDKDDKLIVYESCLDELLDKCELCGHSTLKDKSLSGSCVKYKLTCLSCENVREWSSQPMSGTMPCGNLTMAAAILFSGVSPVKFINAMKFGKVKFISKSTYFSMQSAYLVPAIEAVWNRSQAELLTDITLSDDEVHAGGDARCCSPGHTAKYSSYSIMDLKRGKILDMQLVQSNEVKNSYAMELEGLRRCLAYLSDQSIVPTDLVTDRHSQVKKFMRVERPDIRHWFDVWHVAKGVFKKLEAAGKKKDCEILGDWARSISNHLYWCAASSDGDGDLVQEKWFSILNHVTNVHEGHGEKFTKCEHAPIPIEDRGWMKKGFKSHMALEKVVKGRLLINDVKKLSPAEQTSSLESYHKVVCHFAPKFVNFDYPQMRARLHLSALHFNENVNRAQALTKAGEPQFRISYPKARKGQGVATEVKVQQTFDYIDSLMDEVVEQRAMNNSYQKAKMARRSEPPTPLPLAQSTPYRRSKADIVAERIMRFNS